jgi:hypothetical protein
VTWFTAGAAGPGRAAKVSPMARAPRWSRPLGSR